MKKKYVKRFRFGLEAQIVESSNGMGYYSFKSGGMGGIHNYKEITKYEYMFLRIWYRVLEKIFPTIYRKIHHKSFKDGYNSHGYKEHLKKWGIE